MWSKLNRTGISWPDREKASPRSVPFGRPSRFIRTRGAGSRRSGELTFPEESTQSRSPYQKHCRGVTKAFHFHRKQEDLFVPVSGAFRIVLLQAKSPFEALSIWWKEGAEGTLRIPAGLAHGYRVEGAGEGKMLYLTSETYSPQDEGRMEWDQDVEGFPWKERPEAGF